MHELAAVRAGDLETKDLARLLVDDDFDEPLHDDLNDLCRSFGVQACAGQEAIAATRASA